MVIVVDYEAGNLYNVANALTFLGIEFEFSGDPDTLRKADRVILPGVGSARSAMNSLEEQGIAGVLRELKVPFLGICLGLQLLYETSEEDNTECLGILPGAVRRFDSSVGKVPHIGWNQVEWQGEECGLTTGLPPGTFFYFVHSYYAPQDEEYTLATTNYGVTFSSMVQMGNFVGCQFHPERSGRVGLRLLENFLRI
jgi:glutamine amidotransferase